jgi:hypothetical protein
MSGSAVYLDTSAFLKLIVSEPESEALRTRIAGWPDRASSTLLRTETVRALHRSGNGHLIGEARRLLGGIHLVRLDEPLLDRAADLEPEELRTLDAIHLGAALAIGPDLHLLMTYDARLRDAALAQGLDVESPR